MKSCIDILEQRRLLSVAVENGILTILGTDGADQYTIAAELQPGGAGSQGQVCKIAVTENGVTQRYDASSIRGVLARLGAGDDVFDMRQAAGWATSASLYGGAGDDMIEGGSGNDLIHGEDGNDTLRGGDGRDTVRGLAGADQVYGGLGGDLLKGGGGDDVLRGAAGDDILDGGLGADSLYGGADNDTLLNNDGLATNFADGVSGTDTSYGTILGSLRDRTVNVDIVYDDARLAPMTSRALIDQITRWAVQRQQGQFGVSKHISQITYGPWYLYDGYRPVIGSLDVLGSSMMTDSATTYSTGTTNVQVAGVDEDDIVETDGTLVYWIAGGHLRIIDPRAAGGPTVVSDTALPAQAHGMYLEGSSLTVLMTGATSPVDSLPAGLLQINVYDVSNAQAPSLTRETYLDGSLVTTRMTSSGLHLVLRSTPRVPGVIYRLSDDGNYITYETEEQYRARLAAAPMHYILPGYATRTGGGEWTVGTLSSETVMGADDQQLPSLLTVATLTRSGELKTATFSDRWSWNTVVYASENSIYVAENGNSWWGGWGLVTPFMQRNALETSIVRVDLTAEGPLIAARGEVAGQITGQFAMDEHEGLLRVATTSVADATSPATWGTTNSLQVLKQNGDALEVIGSLSHFGTNERIQSVRFMGDMAYVVTFRQIDPLFAISLADASHPELVGELTIPGFSGYLHPISQTRLLGVGFNADETGRVTGLLLSLFDVSEATDPKRLATNDLTLGSDPRASSAVTGSHHAFSWFADRNMAAVPVQTGWQWIDGHYVQPESRVVFIQVAGTALNLVGTADVPGANRTVAVGDIACVFGTAEAKFVSLDNPDEVIGELQFGA